MLIPLAAHGGNEGSEEQDEEGYRCCTYLATARVYTLTLVFFKHSDVEIVTQAQHDNEVQAAAIRRDEAIHIAEKRHPVEVQLKLTKQGAIGTIQGQTPMINSILHHSSNGYLYYQMVMVSGGIYPPVNRVKQGSATIDLSGTIAVGSSAARKFLNDNKEEFKVALLRYKTDISFGNKIGKFVSGFSQRTSSL